MFVGPVWCAYNLSDDISVVQIICERWCSRWWRLFIFQRQRHWHLHAIGWKRKRRHEVAPKVVAGCSPQQRHHLFETDGQRGWDEAGTDRSSAAKRGGNEAGLAQLLLESNEGLLRLWKRYQRRFLNFYNFRTCVKCW